MRMYLKILTALLLVGTASLAGVPQSMNYQGKLLDTNGDPVANASYLMVFTIYDQGGTIIWQETHPTVQVTGGLFDVLLGVGEHLTYGPLTGDVFADTNRWLGITPGVYGVEDEIAPRTKLRSTSFAFQALRADTADFALATGGNGWTDDGTTVRLDTETDQVGIGTDTPDGKLHVYSNDGDEAVYAMSTSGGDGTAGYFQGGEKGIETYVAGGDGYRYGVMGHVGGDATTNGIGVYGVTNQGETSMGVYGSATNGTNGTFGVVGRAEGSGGTHVGLQGNASDGSTFNYGVEGLAHSSSSGINYGVFGHAWGTANANYGVFGQASGGTENYAGYFNGDVIIQDNVGIGTETPEERLHVAEGIVYAEQGIRTGDEAGGTGIRFGHKHVFENDILPIVACNAASLSWYDGSKALVIGPTGPESAHYVVQKDEGSGITFSSGLMAGSNTLAILDSNGEFAIVDITNESSTGGYIHLYCMYSNGRLTAHYHYRYQ